MSDSNDRRVLTREERTRLGEAIRKARGRMTQAALGNLIGESQTTLSRWEMGEVDIEISQARRIERALGLPAGWVARFAGLVDVDGLLDDAPEGFIHEATFDRAEGALVEVNAAATLGLGVRLSNRMVPDDRNGVMAEEWVVVISHEPGEKP